MINSVNMAWLTIAVAVIVFAIKLLAWWLTGQRGAVFRCAGKHCQHRRGKRRAGRAAHRHEAAGCRAPLRPSQGGIFLREFSPASSSSSPRSRSCMRRSGGLMDPQPLQAPLGGLALAIVATILNGGWALVLRKAGRALALARAAGRERPSDDRCLDLDRRRRRFRAGRRERLADPRSAGRHRGRAQHPVERLEAVAPIRRRADGPRRLRRRAGADQRHRHRERGRARWKPTT